MHSCYFLDWLEPPAAPWDKPRSKFETIDLRTPPARYQAWLPKEADVWYRNDGFFIFKLKFDSVTYGAISGSTRDREKFAAFAVDIASYASDMIKDRLSSPVSVAREDDKPKIDYEHARHTFREIEAKPIKLATSKLPADDSELKACISDNAWLKNLNARIRDNPSGFFSIGEEVPAVLFLRRSFGRSYSKAVAVRQDYKASRLFVSFNWKPFSLKPKPRQITSFARFGFARTLVSFSLWLVIALAFRAFMPEQMHDLPLIREMVVGPSDWDEAIFFYVQILSFVALIAYVRIIYNKRRRTLEAYDRAVGTLQLGNYYQGILNQVMQWPKDANATVPADGPVDGPPEEPVNFEMLIERMHEHKRVELDKRDSNLWWIYRMGAIGIVCLVVANDLTGPIVWFLNTDGMQEIFSIISGDTGTSKGMGGR